MKIYNVSFQLRYNVEYIREKIKKENENNMSVEDTVNYNNMEINNGDDEDNNFQVGAINLPQAYVEAESYLEEIFDEDEVVDSWDITGINVMDLDIVNWPNDGAECQCLTCRTERAAPEDRLNFEHDCSEKIEIVADGWSEFTCPKCGKQIYRDRIVGSNGHYLYINIDKEDKEK